MATSNKRQAASAKPQAWQEEYIMISRRLKEKDMEIKKFLDKKTSKKTKILILEKMLKACKDGGGKLPVTEARKIIKNENSWSS